MQMDINCDLGEDCGNDALIVPWISSANISCGAHAGSEQSIRDTITMCSKMGLAIGAHPSWADRAHFGRKEIKLSPEEIYQLVLNQLQYFIRLLNGEKLHHVKPHGALYNQSAKDPAIATAIAKAVKDTDASLILYGLSGSCSIDAAKAVGLKVASEAFADRYYEADGTLTPRSINMAMITTADEALKQTHALVQDRKVTTRDGKEISVHADTICIHGDGPHAVDFAKAIYTSLKAAAIHVQSL